MIGPLLFDANIIVYLTYVLIVAVDVWLFRTRWGSAPGPSVST